jgi:Cytochrome P460
MKPKLRSLCAAAGMGMVVLGLVHAAGEEVPPAPNGIALPKGYKDWRMIGTSHRTDNQSLRVILGNGTAVTAARKGMTDPWPEGTILAKLVWKDRRHPQWQYATVPGKLLHAEFMIRDSKRFSASGGWGFARWLGMEQKPYGGDASFVQECFGCHQAAKATDHVFTVPAELP